jgi:hypothetical protein
MLNVMASDPPIVSTEYYIYAAAEIRVMCTAVVEEVFD